MTTYKELEQIRDSFDRQLKIATLLEEFRETRSIATATEICDLMLAEVDKHE